MTAELFHANAQTNMTKTIFAFHDIADVPKNGPTARADYTVLLFWDRDYKYWPVTFLLCVSDY
jgi:hypothetical protein